MCINYMCLQIKRKRNTLAETLKVLIVEDSVDDFDLLVRDLKKEPWELSCKRVETAQEMIEALKEPWDLVLSDFSLPNFSGLKALEILQASGLDIPFIIVSGTIGEESAVDVMRAGASDYVLKSKTSRLMLAIRREIEGARGRAKGLTTEKALKDTEEQLRHMQKMEAVGQLAGGVAHDFNNMLSVVQIYCRKLKEFNIPEVNYYVDKILNVHNRSVSLTKQLLIFSRKQTGTATVLNLSQVLVEMQDMLQRLMGETIELEIDTSMDLYKVKIDQGQIEQVLMNLAVNARDAMPEGGRLSFKTSNVQFKEPTLVGAKYLHGNYIVIETKDTGTGINKEIIHRIFEPFFTTKSAKNGTGLGLSIIYGIIHQSEGEIVVASEPGHGTTFKIYLPESNEKGMSQSLPEVLSKTAEGTETILLVEDNYELRSLFAEILEDKGYNVLEASDGQSALQTIEGCKGKIDLVITDMVMPKMGGRELYKQAIQKINGIRFIYMSGYFESSPPEKKDEDFFFLQKPFSEEALLAKVRTVLDKSALSTQDLNT